MHLLAEFKCHEPNHLTSRGCSISICCEYFSSAGENPENYRKTPLISTYVFSGLATEQVLIFGAVLIFGGMIRRRQKFCKEGVCSTQCFPHTTRCCACFSDYVHTSRIQGYLFGGYVLSGHCNLQQISVKTEGTYFRRGTYLRGFTVIINVWMILD